MKIRMEPADPDQDLLADLHADLGLTVGCRVSVLPMRNAPVTTGRLVRLCTWYTLYDYVPTGLVIHTDPQPREPGQFARPGRDEYIPWHNVAKLIVGSRDDA